MKQQLLHKDQQLFKTKSQQDVLTQNLVEGINIIKSAVTQTADKVVSVAKDVAETVQYTIEVGTELYVLLKPLVTKYPNVVLNLDVHRMPLVLIDSMDYATFQTEKLIPWKDVSILLLKGLNDSELNASLELFSTWPSKVQFAFIKCIPTILSLKENKCNITENIYDSIPVTFTKLVVETYKHCNPIAAQGAIDFPRATSDDIMRYYITMSGETFPVSDFIWWFIRKLCGLQWLSMNTTYLLFVWTGLLTELSKSDIYSDAFTKLTRAALSLFVLNIQIFNSEGKTPATSLSSLYTQAGTFTTVIKKLPTEWKSRFSKMLKLPENDNTFEILDHEILNWHMDLGILIRRSNLSIGGAFNMVYTYRIGHEYLLTPPNSWDSFFERVKLSFMNTIIPFPWPQEVEDIKNLYLSEGTSYDERVHEIYMKYYSKLEKDSKYNIILNCGAHIYTDITRLNIVYFPSSTYYIDNQNRRRLIKDDTLIFYISSWFKDRNELSSLDRKEKENIAYDLSRYLDANEMAADDLILKVIEYKNIIYEITNYIP